MKTRNTHHPRFYNTTLSCVVIGILVFGCSSPTEPKEKEKEQPKSSDVILYGKRYGVDLYFRYTTTGEYEVVIPELEFSISGRYREDDYGNMVLDGTGCDGIHGIYYIRPTLGIYYSTSADHCPRHFWLTGPFTRTDKIPQITQKREVNYEHILNRDRRTN